MRRGQGGPARAGHRGRPHRSGPWGTCDARAPAPEARGRAPACQRCIARLGRPAPSPPHRASEHQAVVGRCRAAGRLAAQGVETELEAGVVRHRRGEPLADAPVARPAIGKAEADVGRAAEAPAGDWQSVARLGLEPPASRRTRRPVRPPAGVEPPTAGRLRSTGCRGSARARMRALGRPRRGQAARWRSCPTLLATRVQDLTLSLSRKLLRAWPNQMLRPGFASPVSC